MTIEMLERLHLNVLDQLRKMELATFSAILADVESWKIRVELRKDVDKGVWEYVRKHLGETNAQYRLLGQKLEEIMAEMIAMRMEAQGI